LRADEISAPWRVLSQSNRREFRSKRLVGERKRDNFLNNGKNSHQNSTLRLHSTPHSPRPIAAAGGSCLPCGNRAALEVCGHGPPAALAGTPPGARRACHGNRANNHAVNQTAAPGHFGALESHRILLCLSERDRGNAGNNAPRNLSYS